MSKINLDTSIGPISSISDVSKATEIQETQATQATQATQGIEQTNKIDGVQQMQDLQEIQATKALETWDALSIQAQNQVMSEQEIFETAALEIMKKEFHLSDEMLRKIAPQVGALIANDPILNQAVLSLIAQK
jgi:hypothetical protein